VTFEDNVVVGGNVFVVGHITIGSGARIQAGSIVTKGFPAGSSIGGPLPARDVRAHRNSVASLMRLAKKARN
jgi:UDP-3-O-[3-hydroxymyristoyl] glucosamine N-acyltransferase